MMFGRGLVELLARGAGGGVFFAGIERGCFGDDTTVAFAVDTGGAQIHNPNWSGADGAEE